MSSRQWNETIPDDAPEVAAIMRERGVGRTQATKLLSEQHVVDVSGVSLSQKEQVLDALISTRARNSNELLQVIPEVNGHDVHKLLWACRKSGWVTFRVRKSGLNRSDRPRIFGITVTEAGRSHAIAAKAHKEEAVEAAEVRPAVTTAEGFTSADMSDTVTVPVDLGGTPERMTVSPGAPLSLDDYPLIRQLVRDAKRQERLSSAASILEQAGEDDLALQVMERVTITDLEREVIYLAGRIWKEG